MKPVKKMNQKKTNMSPHYICPEEIKNMTQKECIEKLQEIIFEHKQKLPQGDFKTGLDILKKLYEKNEFEAELKDYYVFFMENKVGIKLRFKFKLHPLLVEYLVERCFDMDRCQTHETSIYSPSSLKSFLEDWSTTTGKFPSYPRINEQYRETIQTILVNFAKFCCGNNYSKPQNKLMLLMIREIPYY